MHSKLRKPACSLAIREMGWGGGTHYKHLAKPRKSAFLTYGQSTTAKYFQTDFHNPKPSLLDIQQLFNGFTARADAVWDPDAAVAIARERQTGHLLA